MKNSMITIVLFLFMFSFLLAEEKDLRPMTSDDSLNMVRVGSAQMSPDGKGRL